MKIPQGRGEHKAQVAVVLAMLVRVAAAVLEYKMAVQEEVVAVSAAVERELRVEVEKKVECG